MLPTMFLQTTANVDWTGWVHVPRRILLAGTPLPDVKHLDYSIDVQYESRLEISATAFAIAFLILTASVVSHHNASTLILVAMPMHPRSSLFSCVRNGGFDHPPPPRSLVERHRYSLIT
ncbi:hypothetical protein GYH30_054178 [Glycine max]|nr:hypothetical protein GYH30_054178 [Glycine max]